MKIKRRTGADLSYDYVKINGDTALNSHTKQSIRKGSKMSIIQNMARSTSKRPISARGAALYQTPEQPVVIKYGAALCMTMILKLAADDIAFMKLVGLRPIAGPRRR